MATRFYIGINETAPDGGAIAPAFDAGWDQTAGAARVRMITTKRNAGFGNVAIAETSTSNTFDVLIRQYISEPINAVSITGTCKGIIRCLESATDADFRAQMVLKVVSRDGTTITGTLLAMSAAALTSEFDATTLTNRKFPLAWAGAGTAVTTVNANQGDRIVLELGYRSHNTLSASRTGTLRFGDSSSTDLAEDETGTLEDNPWFELSTTVVFEALLSERRGLDQPLFTETDRIVMPHGAGVSYVAKHSTHEHTSNDRDTARRAVGSNFLTQHGIGDGFGDRHQGYAESYSPKHSTYEHTSNDRMSDRRPDDHRPLPDALVTFYFKMRALANPGPGYVTWVVTDAPDYTGTQAPAAIQPGTAVVSSAWEGS